MAPGGFNEVDAVLKILVRLDRMPGLVQPRALVLIMVAYSIAVLPGLTQPITFPAESAKPTVPSSSNSPSTSPSPSPSPSPAPSSSTQTTPPAAESSQGITRSGTPKTTATEMVAILRNAKVVNPQYPLRANFNEHEAIVTTQRNPKATDKDCKIDAVLMAKTLMDTYPGEILRVKVLFSDYDKQTCSAIKVTKGDVESYGSGTIKQDEFLESLEISTFKENDSPFGTQAGQSLSVGVAPGFLQDKRLVLLSRIEALQAKGTNTKSFMQYFQQIEELVKQGDEKQSLAMIQSLSHSLDDQEAMRQQANSAGLRQEVLQLQTGLQTKIAVYGATGKKLPFGMNELVQVQQLAIAGRFAEAKKLLQVLQQKLR